MQPSHVSLWLRPRYGLQEGRSIGLIYGVLSKGAHTSSSQLDLDTPTLYSQRTYAVTSTGSWMSVDGATPESTR
jgi:hypothetical protein